MDKEVLPITAGYMELTSTYNSSAVAIIDLLLRATKIRYVL